MANNEVLKMLKKGTHFRFGSIKKMLTLFSYKGLIVSFLNLLLHKGANERNGRSSGWEAPGHGSNPRLHENKGPLLRNCL